MGIGYINHFVHGNFQPRHSQLTPEEVGKFYDNFVATSVDIVPYREFQGGRLGERKKILLGLRVQEPKLWWTIGRTVAPGESPLATIKRTMNEEFKFPLNSLAVDGSDGELMRKRIKLVCINSSVFSVRDQPPKENGRHCFVVVYGLKLEENEIRSFVLLPRSKYHEMRWFSLSEINRELFDPVIFSLANYLVSI